MPRRESYPEKEPLIDQTKMKDQKSNESTFAPKSNDKETEDLMAPEPTNESSSQSIDQ